ncbi:unnamed protein product [Rhodiola kirilowii]
MNDLFSGSFSRFRSEPDNHHSPSSVQMTSTGGVNLDKFFEDVESVKEELKEVENIHRRLLDSTSRAKLSTTPNRSKTSDLKWTLTSLSLSRRPSSSKSN